MEVDKPGLKLNYTNFHSSVSVNGMTLFVHLPVCLVQQWADASFSECTNQPKLIQKVFVLGSLRKFGSAIIY